jgi:hypothetical protein
LRAWACWDEIAPGLGRTQASVNGLQHRGRGALKAALIRAHMTPVTAPRRQRQPELEALAGRGALLGRRAPLLVEDAPCELTGQFINVFRQGRVRTDLAHRVVECLPDLCLVQAETRGAVEDRL